MVLYVFCFIVLLFYFLLHNFACLKMEESNGKVRNVSQALFFPLLALESTNLKSDPNNKNEGLKFCFIHVTSVHKILWCYVQSYFQIMYIFLICFPENNDNKQHSSDYKNFGINNFGDRLNPSIEIQFCHKSVNAWKFELNLHFLQCGFHTLLL